MWRDFKCVFIVVWVMMILNIPLAVYTNVFFMKKIYSMPFWGKMVLSKHLCIKMLWLTKKLYNLTFTID
jgi:hypothetical protein